MSYQPIPTKTEHGRRVVESVDSILRALVEQVIVQQKITNKHLESITDTEITESDID